MLDLRAILCFIFWIGFPNPGVFSNFLWTNIPQLYFLYWLFTYELDIFRCSQQAECDQFKADKSLLIQKTKDIWTSLHFSEHETIKEMKVSRLRVVSQQNPLPPVRGNLGGEINDDDDEEEEEEEEEPKESC